MVEGEIRQAIKREKRPKKSDFKTDVVPDKEHEEIQSKCFISIQHAQNYVLVIEKTLQLNVIGSL